jgi:DNA-binding NtrC family response regulator
MPRVLAVDDSPISCQIYNKVLSPYCSIDSVECAEDALIKLAESKNDLVISDVNLPGISGIELLTKIKKQELNSDTQFIIVSADGDSISDAKKCGAMLWIIKPVNSQSLVNAVKKLLEL